MSGSDDLMTVIHQKNQNTGIIRTVGLSQDLTERIRLPGGHFHIGLNNENVIQSGLLHRPDINFGSRDAPPRPTPQVPTSINVVVNSPQTCPQVPTPTNVVSTEHKRFLTNLYLNRELDRLASFAQWPTERPNISPSELAKQGFYYLGNMDRVQCFSCEGVLKNWTLGDSAEREHRIHSGSCNVVLGNEPLNIPIPSSPESSELLATNYPLRFPSNPHMRGQAQREATFDRSWPTGRINASIKKFAEAGFFYLGKGDQVKCFYCNGGLENWKYEEVPWDEHAKWFPNCQYLLQTKGQRFVHQHLAPNAHIGRPTIGRQDGSPLEKFRRSNSSQGYVIPPAAPRAPTPPPTKIDPQREHRILSGGCKGSNLLNIPSPESPELLATNYPLRFPSNPHMRGQAQRESTFDRRWPAGRINASIKQFAEAGFFYLGEQDKVKCWYCNGGLQNWEFRDDPLVEHLKWFPHCALVIGKQHGSPGTFSGKLRNDISSPPNKSIPTVNIQAWLSYYDGEDIDDDDLYGGEPRQGNEVAGRRAAFEALQQQFVRTVEERMCKLCHARAAVMSLLPCSHLVSCVDCMQDLTICPICGESITVFLKFC